MYEVDTKNGFMEGNFHTESISFAAVRSGKKKSLQLGKIYDKGLANVRFKVEPKGKYAVRELSLLQLQHENLIRLISSYDYGENVMHMYPYYEFTLQMLRMSLPKDAKHTYYAKIPRKISLEILSAIEYLHQKGICHRGIKDSNIYIVRCDENKADWLQNGDFFTVLGENSTLKIEKSHWIVQNYCTSDSGILSESNDEEHDEAKLVLKEIDSSFIDFNQWIKYDLVKVIELIAKVYTYCGFSKSSPEIKHLELMSFKADLNIEDIKSHPLFMDRNDTFIMLQTVVKAIEENGKTFQRIEKQSDGSNILSELKEIGNGFLGPEQNWLNQFTEDRDILEKNFKRPKTVFIGKYYKSFLKFVHILLKHAPEMKLKSIGIIDKWDAMDYITQKVPTFRMQGFLLRKKLEQIGVITDCGSLFTRAPI